MNSCEVNSGLSFAVTGYAYRHVQEYQKNKPLCFSETWQKKMEGCEMPTSKILPYISYPKRSVIWIARLFDDCWLLVAG